MTLLRRIVLWIGLHIPLGRLNPYLVGFGINRKPEPTDEKDS